MTARSSRPDPPTPRPLSNWSITAGALVVLAIAAVVSLLLLRRYGGQGAQIQLDAIRTAGTLIIGTGGAVALLLTARRQRYTELTLVHTTRDATERRITELYTKAADQLGSDQAPVRLAGLYALERLAHSAVEHRQSIVDVICAYLRMPYMQPSVSALRRFASGPWVARRRWARTLAGRLARVTPASQELWRDQAEQERQVRLTAQNILRRNLRVVAQRRRRWWHRSSPPVPAWPGIQLNLSGALLLGSAILGFYLSDCQFDHANFEGAQFASGANFGGTQFTSAASFSRAQFTGEADFAGAQFTSAAFFLRAQFIGFTSFRGAQFVGRAYFRGAQFTGRPDFRGAQFIGEADFAGAQFTGAPHFEGVRVASAAGPVSVWPPGWTTRSAKSEDGEDPAFLYLTKVEEPPTSVMGT